MDLFFLNGEGCVFLFLEVGGLWVCNELWEGVYLLLKCCKENINKLNKEINKNLIFKMFMCKRVYLRFMMIINFYRK